MSDAAEKEMYGEDMFGGAQVVSRKGALSQRFKLPPFTVLNAAEGWWQKRKQAWRELGIKSELGRGANVLGHPETTGNMSFYVRKRELEEELRKSLTTEEAVEILAERGLIGMMDEPGPDGEKKGLLGLSEGCNLVQTNKKEYTDRVTPGGRGKNSKYKDSTQGRLTDPQPGDARTFGSGSPGDLSKGFKQKETASLKTGLAYGMTNDPYRKGGEDTPSAAGCGTSIFDPVLCEMVYRWFVGPGGQVVDPFSGGSVRGVVAALLGRKYWGCDLARDQIVANEEQARELVYGDRPQVEKVGRFRVVRDDRVPGGTKERALRLYLPDLGATKVVYASPAQGFAQVAVARVCRDLGIEFHLFIAERKEQHPRTLLAEAYGAVLHKVSPGYLATVEARAREWADAEGARLLPFGLHSTKFIGCLVEVIRGTPGDPPTEVWVAAGSGTLATAIRKAWPDAAVHAVQVGREVEPELKADRGVTVHVYDRDFADPARVTPPFPSVMEYDAKAWELMQDKGAEGALFWNVASDTPPLRWVNGDSNNTLALAPQADLVFSCPPYYDLEEYSTDPRDLSHMAWDEFVAVYQDIIGKACDRLRDDRFACFVVGDVRDPDGIYRNLPGLTTKAFRRAGLPLYNEACLVTAVGSLSIRAERQFVMSRKMGKTHQNVLVYCKGDPVKATDAATGMTAEERRKALERRAMERKKAFSGWNGLAEKEERGKPEEGG